MRVQRGPSTYDAQPIIQADLRQLRWLVRLIRTLGIIARLCSATNGSFNLTAHMTNLSKPPRGNGRTALGLVCGALVAACTATAMEIINRNLGGLRDDPLRFSALVPLAFGLFSLIVFLPIVCAVHARVNRGSKAIWYPTLVFAGVAAAIPMLFPGPETRIVVLGLSALATVGLPLWLSSFAAVRIWRHA